MATIATRLTSAGTLLVNGTFDETAQTTISVKPDTVLASTIDEISLASGAISLNGTSQYLTVPGSTNWQFGTGDFTVEWWQYMTSTPANPRVFSVGTYPSASIAVSIETDTLYVWEASAFRFSAALTNYTNVWNHFAISRVSNTTRVFRNGTQLGSSYVDNNNISNSSSVLTIGQESTPASGSYFPGYISNFRIIKGTGIYTANFTPPNSALPSVTNTQLLLNATDSANYIKDNSPNNLTVTPVGSPTWISNGPFNQGSTTVKQKQTNGGIIEVSGSFDEITGAPLIDGNLKFWIDAAQTTSYSGSGSNWADLSTSSSNVTLYGSPTFTSNETAGDITFVPASTQYGMTSTNLGSMPNFTVEAWVKVNASLTGVVSSVVTNEYNGSSDLNYSIGTNRAPTDYNLCVGFFNGAWRNTTGFVPTLNVWYQIVGTYDGTTLTQYVNGTANGSPLSYSGVSSSGGNTRIARRWDSDTASGNLFPGDISVVRIYNRALSADEVAQNFNAHRRRYNI